MGLEVGTVCTGKITSITKYGAFVSLEGGKSGMVHISEVADSYVSDINEHLKVGQDVKVKVITIGDNGKISLSIKKAVEPVFKPKDKDEDEPRRRPAPRPRPAAPKQEAPVFTGNPDMDWTPTKSGNAAFEDMMAKFKKSSEDRASDMKRNYSTKRDRRGH